MNGKGTSEKNQREGKREREKHTRRIYIEEKEKNCGKKEEKREKREVNRNKIVKSHEKKRKTSKSV